MKNAKLHVYILERRKPFESAVPIEWCLTVGGSLARVFWGDTKNEATARAARILRQFFEDFGQCSELKIRNARGTFDPARTYPRSADPRRSKG